MKNWKKVILGVALSFMVFFTAIGYAALTDNLTISGTLNASAPNDIFITKITSIEGLPTTQTGLRSMETTISGTAGQTVTYAIEVKNNTDDTYVYAGASKPFIAWTEDDDGNSLSYEITNAYSTGPLIGAHETLTIYVQYTIETPTVVQVTFDFKKPVYTITYINNGETIDVRYVYNNSEAVSTENSNAVAAAKDLMGEGEPVEFAYWMNSGSSEVEFIPAGYPGTGDSNTVTLYPKFYAPYTAMFVNQDGSLLAWCFFNNVPESKYHYSNTVPLAETIATDNLNKSLEGLKYEFSLDHWVVRIGSDKKETYDITAFAGYKSDVTIYPFLRYEGADLNPYDEANDGDIDYYEVMGYKDSVGATLVVIPSDVNGVPVTIINPNAFSSYDDLHAVVIPETVTTINSQAFTANNGTGRDTVTLYYQGDPATWEEAMTAYNNGDRNGMLKQKWDYYMGAGSRVFFLDENDKVITKGYWQLCNHVKRLGIWSSIGGSYKWVYHDHEYGDDSSCDLHHASYTNYTDTCSCDLGKHDRPDAKYWTDAATTSTFGLRDEIAPEETTAPTEETTAPPEETTAPPEETTAPTEETTAPEEETTTPEDEATP